MNMDLQGLLEKAQKLKTDLDEAKKLLANKIVTVDSGGGMVKVTANGNQQIIKIEIDKTIINPDESRMLEDLVLAAVNKAMAEAQRVAADEIAKVSGMLPNMPGFNMFT
jgi:nucleoid-associated protein EbfC